MAELVQYYGTGRRKRAIARVYLRPGSGDFKVNGRAFEEYFVTPAQRSAAKSPLASSDTAATFNVIASVLGGGVRGQASDISIEAEEILKMRERLIREIALETGQTYERVVQDTERNFWMGAEEAKAYGLVSKVIQRASEV